VKHYHRHQIQRYFEAKIIIYIIHTYNSAHTHTIKYIVVACMLYITYITHLHIFYLWVKNV